MNYFLDTVETIETGVGFSHYDFLHISWLIIFAITVLLNCFYYKKASSEKRSQWRKIVSALIVADEIFKMAMLTLGGNYTLDYLPLHLCSINIFIIAYHAYIKPNKALDSLLYTVCIPGAMAALLFPSWAVLPLANFMHLHSFTVHILLALYPIVLTYGGDIRPTIKDVPMCVGILLALAAPIYLINLALNTNFMFLMRADEGNPLLIFQNIFGSHLWGFPIIIAAIVVVMYLPWVIADKKKKIIA